MQMTPRWCCVASAIIFTSVWGEIAESESYARAWHGVYTLLREARPKRSMPGFTESRGDPSKDRRPSNAQDTEPWIAGLLRRRVEGPSTSDTVCPDPTPRPEAARRRPRASGLRHGCYPPAARSFGLR